MGRILSETTCLDSKGTMSIKRQELKKKMDDLQKVMIAKYNELNKYYTFNNDIYNKYQENSSINKFNFFILDNITKLYFPFETNSEIDTIYEKIYQDLKLNDIYEILNELLIVERESNIVDFR